jgi:hypothetical protein
MLKDMTLCDEVFHTASGVAFADFHVSRKYRQHRQQRP